MKLTIFLALAAVASLGLALWSLATFPIIKFGTETIVRGRLAEVVEQAQVTAEDRNVLDKSLDMIVSNDRQWQRSHEQLHMMSVLGFLVTALCFGIGAWKSHHLERQLASAESKRLT